MNNAISQITVGDSIPPFVRRTGLANWNRYAAVNYEFIDIHMDDEAGRAAGYESAFGMGNLLWSYLHNVLRQWADGLGRIVTIDCQYRGPNTKGMTLTAAGIVTAIRDFDDRREVVLDIWIEDQEGKKLTPGNATVALYR